MPIAENPEPSSGRERTRMGLRHDGISAWVKRGATEYRVAPRKELHEYVAPDYAVELVAGPDALDHDYVRECAQDAFLDAYGAN